MASRKSPSSARSAPRADPAGRFRAALDAAVKAERGSLQHALQQSLRSKDLQRCAKALARAADAASRSDSNPRPHRIQFPANSLPPTT